MVPFSPVISEKVDLINQCKSSIQDEYSNIPGRSQFTTYESSWQKVVKIGILDFFSNLKSVHSF